MDVQSYIELIVYWDYTIIDFRKTTRHKIVGCPVHIDGERYERYFYIFNICFVFDCQANTSSYEKVLKKLVHYFTVLEVRNEEPLAPFVESHWLK